MVSSVVPTSVQSLGRPFMGRPAHFRVSVLAASVIRGAAERMDDADLAARSRLPFRDLKKMDRFSVLAVAGADSLLRGMMPLPEAFSSRCGVFLGNMTGGWTFTARELRVLHAESGGPSEVSPYLATAWFPAAPQGQVSIRYRLRGPGKTIATDRTAGAAAIAAAIRYVARVPWAVAIGGGVEAPATPFVQRAFGGRRRLAEESAMALFGPAGSGADVDFKIHANCRRTARSFPALEGMIEDAMTETSSESIFASLETEPDLEACEAVARASSLRISTAYRPLDTLGAESASVFIEALEAIQGGLNSALVICSGLSNILLFSFKKPSLQAK